MILRESTASVKDNQTTYFISPLDSDILLVYLYLTALAPFVNVSPWMVSARATLISILHGCKLNSGLVDIGVGLYH